MKAPISSDFLDPKIKNRSFLSTIWMAWTSFIDNFIATASEENPIINGGFDFWRYATSQTSSGYGSDDRWLNSHNGSTKTHSRQTFTVGQTDVSGNPKYYSQTVVTSSAGASNLVTKNQKIEGVENFANETITLSFDAWADANRPIATEFSQNFGTGGTPSAEVTAIGVKKHALTTLKKRFSYQIKVPSISGKTLGTNNNDCIILHFWFDAGTDYNARTNLLGQQSGTFNISNVKISRNDTPYRKADLAAELIRCQRFLPAFIGYGTADDVSDIGVNTTSRGVGLFDFVVEPRIPPTGITVSSAAHFSILEFGGTSHTATAISFSNSGLKSARLLIDVAATPLTPGNAGVFYGTSTSAKILFTGCEL